MLMLTEKEKQRLEIISNQPSKSKAKRAKIILYLGEAKDIDAVHQELNVSLKTVQLWEQRWQERSKESDVAKRLANETKLGHNYKRPKYTNPYLNAIFGKWPGNETDEEIEKFLEEIS